MNAAELGRLFFSPAERKAMNEKRLSPTFKPVARAIKSNRSEPDAEDSAEVSESVRLPEPKITGKVTRSSGNNTIWINHSPNYLPSAARPPSVDRP
jgi:hypothetical protein